MLVRIHCSIRHTNLAASELWGFEALVSTFAVCGLDVDCEEPVFDDLKHA